MERQKLKASKKASRLEAKKERTEKRKAENTELLDKIKVDSQSPPEVLWRPIEKWQADNLRPAIEEHVTPATFFQSGDIGEPVYPDSKSSKTWHES